MQLLRFTPLAEHSTLTVAHLPRGVGLALSGTDGLVRLSPSEARATAAALVAAADAAEAES